MTRTILLVSSWLIFIPAVVVAEKDNPGPNLNDKAEQLISRKGSLRFRENKGQIADQNGKPVPDVLFSASVGRMNLFLTKTGYTYVLLKEIPKKEKQDETENILDENDIRNEHEQEEESKKPKSFEYNRIDVLLKGATIAERNIIKEYESPEHFNFFYPHCPQGIYDVKEYERVTIKNVYPNIDWVWYIDNEKACLPKPGQHDGRLGLKYDFIVHPGASAEQIKLVYNFADLSVNKTGNLLSLSTPLGKLSEGNLISYSGEKEIGSFFQKHENEISLSISHYDRSQDLIIDPPLALLWSTNYGGAAGASTGFRSSDLDSQGNLVAVAFATNTLVFPTKSWGGAYFQGAVNATSEIAISKFTNAGVRLWATFYGGSGAVIGGIPYDDDVYDIVCDRFDNILVTGYTGSTDFPVQSAFQSSNAGYNDMYIIKFNSIGVRQWATYFGGTGSDTGGGITTDISGNVYIIGVTRALGATNFTYKDPGGGAYFQNTTGTTNSNDYQQFIAEFDPAGNLLWSTLFGNETNGAASIEIDNSGNIVIAGVINNNSNSQSNQWIPLTNPGGGAYFQTIYTGSWQDLYFAKFTPSRALYWCTYFGGTQKESLFLNTSSPCGNALYIDNCDNIFCIASAAQNTILKDPGNGAFFSSVPPPSNVATQPLLIKFNSASSLTWSTYLAVNTTTNGYEMYGIACSGDRRGNLFVVGNVTHNHTIPLVDPAGGAFYQATHPSSALVNGNFGKDDGWIMGFCPNGAMKWSTYITTSDKEEMDDFMSVNCDNNGNIFCVGERMGTTSFPYVNPGAGAYFQNSTLGALPPTGGAGGGSDWQGTISKFQATNFTCPTLTTTLASNSSQCGCNGTATVNASNGTPAYTYSWLPGGQNTQTAVGLCPGTYTVITNDAGCERDTNIVVVAGVGASMPLTMAQTNATCGSANGTASVIASGGSGNYTYSWSSGQTGQTLTGLSAGTYTVTVRDGNGCTSIGAVNITQPVLSVSTVTNGTACNNENGSAIAWPAGAAGPYSYLWSNGSTGNNAGYCPATTFQGVAYCVSSGTYTVTVTSGNGCSQTAAASVPSSPGNDASFTFSPTGTVCAGATINFNNAGTPPGAGITYNWVISPITPANVSGTTTNFSYTFLTVGTYTVKHTVSGNGCNTMVSKVLNVIDCGAGPTVIAIGNSVCAGSCASVTSSGAGGSSPYTYSWSNGVTTQNINSCPVSTTTYTVTIKDAGGNTSTSTAVVTVNPAVTVSTTPTSITCSGVPNGSVVANPGGGTPSYIYVWSNGQTSQTATNLSAGNYIVTVVDTKGCTSTSTTIITSPPPLAGQFTKGAAACTGCGCKQWIMINAAGGTSPYYYLWPDGNVNRYKNQLCPGNYSVNIKDKNGCSVNVKLTAP